MKHYVSFTSILTALHEKKLTVEELNQGVLCLGCAREHVFGDHIPMEVSWQRGNKSCYDRDGINADDLTPESLDTWRTLRSIFEKAEAEGRLHFRIGNYPAYCQKCNEQGVPVWWQVDRLPEAA